MDVSWEITRCCNLACKHCGVKAGEKRPYELTQPERYRLLPQLATLGTERITISGGEPLLDPDFLSLVGALSHFGFEVHLTTNGTLFTRKMISCLSQLKIGIVSISIDGPQEIHDSLRGRKGVYRKALQAVKDLACAGIPVCISTVVTKVSVDWLLPIRELVAELGIPVWQLLCLVKVGNAVNQTNLHCNQSHFRRLEEFIITTTQNRNWPFQLHVMDCEGMLHRVRKSSSLWQPCVAGRSHFAILSDGRIKGCLTQPNNCVIGSVFDKPLEELWHSSEDFRLARDLSKKHRHISHYSGGCTTIV